MASTYPFKKHTVARIVFPILDADGDPVPDAAGLDSQVSINGATFVPCTDEAHNIANPGGATNTGLYYLDLTADEMDGDEIAIQVKTSTSDAKTTMLVIYTAAQTDDETKGVLDGVAADYAKTGEAAAFSAQGESAVALAAWITAYEEPLFRILGLIQENQVIDNTTFDGDGNMLTARIRTFTDATLITVLATYNLTAVYDVDGNLTTFQVVKA